MDSILLERNYASGYRDGLCFHIPPVWWDMIVV